MARTQELLTYLQGKRTEQLDLMKQYELTITTAKDQELIATTKSAFSPLMSARDEVIRVGKDPRTKTEAATWLHDRVEPFYAKFQEATEAEVSLEKASAEDATARIQSAVATAQTGMIISLLVAFILASVTGYLVVQAVNRPLQEMIRRVQKSGLQVNTSATQIAATAQEQLSTASEVAATTSEIGATSKQISATSRELAGTIKDISEVAEKTAALAGSGQAGLARMKATMQQVMEASSSISARLATLSEKAGNIGIVVTTITKVADRTNLLSLNAAIEAEKAGDYGRGFAVVATEIRRLADQTAVATGDIEQMVKEMQSAVAAGVMGMDKFSEEVRRGVEVVQQVSGELSQIIHHVQALTPNFETVSDGMQSQSLGAQQISDSLSQLSEAAQQTVESLRQSNSAIGQLNDASRGLQDGVARFTAAVLA